MDHTYRFPEDRASLFIIGIPFSLIGGLFVTVGVLTVLGSQDSSGSMAGRIFTGLICAGIGSLGAYLGLDHLVRRPWLVVTRADGTVEIRRAFRITRLPIGSITALEKCGRKVGLEDEDGRILKIRHAGGAIPISGFDEMEELIADIQSRDPAVLVQGWWNERAV